MKITLIEDSKSELEIQITYSAINKQVQGIIDKVKSLELKILGSNEKGSKLIALNEIYYVESVERKTFLYTEKEIYRCNKKIYEIIEEWEQYGFVQTAKMQNISMRN